MKREIAYSKPPGVGQVDAANLARTKVLDEPVDGSVDVLDSFLLRDVKLRHRKLDPQLPLQVRHHGVNRLVLLHSQRLGFLVVRPTDVGHDDGPANTRPRQTNIRNLR